MAAKDEKTDSPVPSADDDERDNVSEAPDEEPSEQDEDESSPTSSEEPEEAEPEADVEDAGDDDDEPSADASTPWTETKERAQQLWDAGNNAELRKVLDELDKAPPEEKEIRAFAEEMRNRLKPDPVAIGLWLFTLAIFCLLTYLFVLR